MLKKINIFFFYSKIVLLLVAFALEMYIIFSMNALDNGTYGTFLMMMLPFILVLLTFVFSFFFENGKKHLFYNISSFIAIIAIIMICVRTISDSNMVMWSKWKMNLYFFENNISEIKIMLYLMFGCNILLFMKKEKKYADNNK